MTITELIDCKIETKSIIKFKFKFKWSDFIDGGDGYLYGIPLENHKAMRFHPKLKSMKEIGPNLGDGCKYWNGIRAKNGCIYCMPYAAKYFLKISPKEDDADVEILEGRKLPEDGEFLWSGGALAEDGCIYYMPANARRILRLDPNDNDCLSSVGEDFGDEKWKTGGAVAGKDGMIYGIPHKGCKNVIQFDPIKMSICNVGASLMQDQRFSGGVLGHDGNIYSVNRYGEILVIDTVKNDWKVIGNRKHSELDCGWGSPVVGPDKCIYSAPFNRNLFLKYDPSMQEVSFIGESLGSKENKWIGGANTTDGLIYYLQCNANQVLQIDVRTVDKKYKRMVRRLIAIFLLLFCFYNFRLKKIQNQVIQQVLTENDFDKESGVLNHKYIQEEVTTIKDEEENSKKNGRRRWIWLGSRKSKVKPTNSEPFIKISSVGAFFEKIFFQFKQFLDKKLGKEESV